MHGNGSRLGACCLLQVSLAFKLYFEKKILLKYFFYI